MLSRIDLRRIAATRLRDAQVLLAGTRYDGSLYLCGYALECQLKARIVTTHGWLGFPETRGEFQDIQSFKTHDLDVLLSLSGRERPIRANHTADWSEVAQWDPEARYQRAGFATLARATEMLSATRRLLRHV